MLNSYLTQIRMNLLLTLRNRVALFFSYYFPADFLLRLGQGRRGGNGMQVVNIVLASGCARQRFVRRRECAPYRIANRISSAALRSRPSGPAEIIVSGMVTALALQTSQHGLHDRAGAPFWARHGRRQPVSLTHLRFLGTVGVRVHRRHHRGVGELHAGRYAVTQLFYFPMLFLGGVTFPIAVMPPWLQTVAQFIPSTYFSTGLQPILRGKETLFDNLPAAGGARADSCVGNILAAKLFRWEKEEKLRPAAKLWLLAVLGPFFVLGAWQMHAKTNIAKEKILAATPSEAAQLLIRDARLFLGDGTVIDQGSVLIKDGKIAEIYTGPAPDAKALRADVIEAAGKTLLPGLIDVHVHLGAPGLPITDPQASTKPRREFRS